MMTSKFKSYLYGSFQFKQNGLRDEYLACLGAQVADLSFEQLDLFARPAATDFQQPVYDGVEVNLVLVRHCHCG